MSRGRKSSKQIDDNDATVNRSHDYNESDKDMEAVRRSLYKEKHTYRPRCARNYARLDVRTQVVVGAKEKKKMLGYKTGSQALYAK